jgi:hypothetical protein
MFSVTPVRACLAAVVLVVVVSLGLAWLSENTKLTFSFQLDGRPLPAGIAPTVRLDGKPFTSGLTLRPGPHTLSAELPNAEPLKRHVWAFFGHKDLGVLPLESSRSSLLVAVTPAPARVLVRRGDATLGNGDAPLSVERLPFGEYQLEITRGEYREIHPVTIQAGPRTEARIELNLGSVRLASDPPDADFRLSGNGRQWNGALPTLIGDVPAGDYRFTALRKGWELSAPVSVSRGAIATNRLEFPYASIEITSDPAGLVISTNGVEVGRTPLVLRDLVPGSFGVTATDGQNDLSETIRVEPKENAKRTFVLRYGSVRLSSTPPGATVVRQGKAVGKTPIELERVAAGESTLTLKLDGYVTTHATVRVADGETASLEVKMRSERYVQAMQQARAALDAKNFEEARRFVEAALGFEPDDPEAKKLRDEISQAAKKMEEEDEDELTWLDFDKFISDCTETKQVQYQVIVEDGYWQDYIDENGKRKRRWIKTGEHTETKTKTESTFSPAKFSEKYEGRRFRFNCPGKWRVSKVEKDGVVVFRPAGLIPVFPPGIKATPPVGNTNALGMVQKGQKIKIKAVVRRFEVTLGGTLHMENAKLLVK